MSYYAVVIDIICNCYEVISHEKLSLIGCGRWGTFWAGMQPTTAVSTLICMIFRHRRILLNCAIPEKSLFILKR